MPKYLTKKDAGPMIRSRITRSGLIYTDTSAYAGNSHIILNSSAANQITGSLYVTSNISGSYLYGDGSNLINVGAGGSMTQFVLEDDSGDEVTISNNKEVKFIGSGITIIWTDTSPGSDGDPYDLTFTVDAAQTGVTSILNAELALGRDADNQIQFATDDEIKFNVAGGVGVTFKASGEIEATSLDISGDADIGGTMEADAITVNGSTLASVIAGTTVSNATLAATFTCTDNEDEDLNCPIIFVDSATGAQGAETDGDLHYNPSTGKVTATTFVGNIDAVDGDFDGTLEADAITVGGVALNTVIAGVTVDDATTAARATTVTITDNESTDEDNAIVFTSGGDVDGGNIGLESDGSLTYNPSTGKVTATLVAGVIDPTYMNGLPMRAETITGDGSGTDVAAPTVPMTFVYTNGGSSATTLAAGGSYPMFKHFFLGIGGNNCVITPSSLNGGSNSDITLDNTADKVTLLWIPAPASTWSLWDGYGYEIDR